MRFRLPHLPWRLEDDSRLRQGDWSYFPARGRMRSFNRVTPLRGGERAFPAMLTAIARAKRHVHLEMYILRDDTIGQRFKEALAERARAGVDVRLLYDGLGSIGLSSAYVGDLETAGVEIVVFHPVAPWRARWGLNKRDHKKILIVDDAVAFTGGINIGDEYLPVEDGGGGWHDMHARIEGPAVYDLARIFLDTWERAGGTPFPRPRAPYVAQVPASQLTYVQVISNAGVITRSRMRVVYIHAIRRAETRISIMNSYFIPDVGLRRAFANAVRRGVSVRIIVPSRSDVKVVYYASRRLYGRLLRAGVRIFEWQGEMMHAKVGAIDAVWSTIGSYNLDRRSLLHNLEVGLIMIDRGVAGDLDAQFELDLARCREVKLDEWLKRPLWEKLLERFWYVFRYWL